VLACSGVRVCARDLRAITSDVGASGDNGDGDDDVRAEEADVWKRRSRRDPESDAGEAMGEDPRGRVDVHPVARRVLARHRPLQALRELW